MDPATPMTAAIVAVIACASRLVHLWITARADIRRAAVNQRGLSDRIRSLPPGSRLTERTRDRQVEVLVGGDAPREPDGGGRTT
ncbi:hypothetical protein [Streptomyces sp. RerS4]|uniref:hypothetical protein n=1 Tax=Streptomyces sp. RerS4 TaxID=2942449 RepID=UPI00201C05E4|nr:hypothetical protein [Streptomyces sp. RerS4]UQX04410.1 hypothetical protein M4D82_30825 [Streptomyces sp. RerS4]